MDEIELKAYFFPWELDSLKNIETHISSITNSNWIEHNIRDTFYYPYPFHFPPSFDLRCREINGTSTLTYKGVIDLSGGYKKREELNLNVDDFETLHRILEKIGFKKRKQIIKKRKLINFNNTSISIDYFTHIGAVIEIEGTPDLIESTISLLCLPRPLFQPITHKNVLERFRSARHKTYKL